ncbi:polymeric immunoglobulin receptor isoform X3 [Carassius gibelio]|uniref:polymeric immunoglobulin receptor isoform X3 n=1 Tax=Carassius gibelio TaxID=101364 RepID=UPI0022796B43|nr:polymeric immunoglobulin receptor isoform X3 [Carassius gibelio]
MKIIWTFTLLMIPGVLSSISVTGYSGGGVSITCRYDRGYTDKNKYFCRGEWSVTSLTKWWSDLIKTEEKNKWVDSGRFSLYDDTSAAVFTVTIRDLSEQDSGTYYCAVDRSWAEDSYTEVNLNVVTADCCQKSISLSAAAGGSVNISCRYPQSHSADVKFVCRRSGSDLCAEETSVKESRRWSAEGQMQLYDDREQQLLTGIISHVTQQHSAEYWCGVQSDPGHKSFITRVLVTVTDVQKTTSSPASVFNTSTSTITSESPNTLKGLYLIISLVLVLLVLIIIGVLLLVLYKKHQSRAGGDSSSQTGAEKHEVVSNTGCDYEEIKDSHKQLPTNPSVSPDCVYATAQLPTNPSVSPDCVYATVQKDTGDSQIFITSAEDLNYSVVNFQKKADCPEGVRLRNNQDYSEYAAVNHLTD